VAGEERLHERGVVIIPDALAGAGAMLAVGLRERGADDRTALARTSSLVAERARALLELAERSSLPLSAVVRAPAEAALEDPAGGLDAGYRLGRGSQPGAN
jgi:hypothetical protein